ncbi:MAG: Gmad2 immunoglobulin-like domain-containing protein [Candidatus Dormibacteraeota bacterium]|nr:Gmad2 immunoglobulin-like domain-containing protein [Candidatus Dormibacteraeota bacterium]
MKALPVALVGIVIGLGLTGCGSSDQTQFVLTDSSASPSASASGTSPSATASPSTSSGGTGAAATPIAGGSRIVIDTPDASSSISSPVQVSGAASVDKGTVVAVVLDSAGKELGRASATASASAPAFGHYDVSVPFSGATSGTSGKLKVFGVRADGTTPTYFYFITVRFP